MKKGFTLIELMVVAMIFSLITVVAIPIFTGVAGNKAFEKYLNDPTLSYNKDDILSNHEKLHLSLIREGKRNCTSGTCTLNHYVKTLLNDKYDEMQLADNINLDKPHNVKTSNVTITKHVTIMHTNYVDSATPKEEYDTIDFNFHRQ